MKYGVLSKSLLAAAALVAIGCVGAQAQADSINVTQTAIPAGTFGTSNVNLTTQGSIDWFYFDGTTSTTTKAAGAGTLVQKDVTTHAITPPAVGAGGWSSGTAGQSFTWTDGTPTTSGTDAHGFTKTDPVSGTTTSSDTSFSFTVTADGNEQTLIVSAGSYGFDIPANVTDTYTLGSSTPVSVTNTSAKGTTWWYDTVNFQGTAGETLTVNLAASANPGSTSGGKVLLAAATLSDASPVPEPASLGLMGIGGATLLLVGRRKRA